MSDYPFGQTEYRNYDPEQVNTVEDAIGLLEWFADRNETRKNREAAFAYTDAANLLRDELVATDAEQFSDDEVLNKRHHNAPKDEHDDPVGITEDTDE